MTRVLDNLRYALRTLLKRPAFTAVTVGTLALGIGANTAIFSVVDGVLLEALPYSESDRLVAVSHAAPGLDLPSLPSATGIHLITREESRTLQETALYQTSSATLTGDGAPERIRVGRATPSLFRVLRVGAARGRTFTPEEGLPGAERVVILSHGLWSERFGSDPAVVGTTVRLDGTARQVIGVMPEGFAFPDPEVRLWTPIRIDPAQTSFGGFNFPAIARLADGVEVADARAELGRLLGRLPERFEGLTARMIENTGLAVEVDPYLDVVVGDVRTALWILLGTVGFVLLIACANVANLLLVRAESRQKEVAIRTAMGGDRKHLFGQFLAESGILAGAGAVLGLILAHQGIRALLTFGPENLPRVEGIDLDGTVLAFTAGISVVAALVFGLIPLIRSRASSTAGILRDGSRGSTEGRAGHRARKLLVISQVAFALILLVGSGLMVRSFQSLRDVDPGFSSESVLTFRVDLPGAGYPDVAATAAFHQEFLDRVKELPGVEVAGVTSHIPLTGFNAVDPLMVEGRPQDPDEVPPVVASRAATPGFFEALDIPVYRGRGLERRDAESRAPVVLLSRKAVDVFFEGQEPLQREVAQGTPTDHADWSRIVGVVGDIHWESLTEPAMPTMYYPVQPADGVNRSWLVRSMAYVVKTSVPPTSIVPAVRRTLAELDPDLPLAGVRTMEDVTRDAQSQMAFTMLLLGIAAGVGLLLGSVGLYGVLSFVTAQRTREIGVRLALGADGPSVRRMVVAQGLAVTGAGVVVGLLGAFLLSRLMESVLYGVSATDPVTFAVVPAVLLLVSWAATWVPARRAARTDPARALRWE